MDLNETLSFCSAVLGAFMAIPLLGLRRQRPANFWLGMCVLSLSLLSFASTRAYQAHPQWFGLLDWPVAAVGPFYHCYVRSMVGLGNGRRQVWHFVPLMIEIALLVRHSVFHIPFDFGPFFVVCEVLATGYAIAAVFRLRAYRRRLLQNYSSLQNRDLAWLSWLSVLMVLIMFNWVFAVVFRGIWDWLLLFNRVLILYFVGWFGLRHASVFVPGVDFTHSGGSRADSPPVESAGPPAVVETTAEAESPKYARSGMNQEVAATIGQRLSDRVSRHRDFLESDLTLADLAERIGTSPQLLSQYLNDKLGLNFFDYINGLRVAEVQRLMADPAHRAATLLELAYAAGFNSKSTFNNAFRKIGGTTPSEWRRLNVLASEPIR